MKNKKEVKEIIYNYSEEFITTIQKPTGDDLKEMFNKKYFNLIKRIEKRNLGGCYFE